MTNKLTAKQQEQIRQAAASMAIENMPVSEDSYRDAIDYLSGSKSEREILDCIAKRARHLNCNE